MFPVILDLSKLNIALVGGGFGAIARLKSLKAAGATNVSIFADNFGKEFWDLAGNNIKTRMPNDEELKNFYAVMIVDVDVKDAISIAKKVRSHGSLVNVEGVAEYCDFYCPSIVRRGDLLIAVSTLGKSPTLAKRVKGTIGKIFHNGWSKKLEDLAFRRVKWQEIGLNGKEINNMSNKYIDEKGWLDYEELASKEEAR